MTLNRAVYVLALFLSLIARERADAQHIIQPTVGDSTVVAVIAPAGAMVEFPGVAQLRFPAGAFVAPETVTVWLSNLPLTDKGREYYRLGGGGIPPYLPQDMTVRAPTQPRQELEVVFLLSAASLDCAPADFVPRVFREFIGGGSMEALVMYQALPSTLDVSTRTIRARAVTPPVEQGPELYEVFHVGCFRP